MGKKKAEEMAQHRELFRAGAAKNDLSAEKADEIFDLMEKFAGYGFNKSHAAAYALLSYHTAYLKAHHPAAFMAANLSLAMDDTDKIKILVEDAIDVCGLTLLPPDINQSDYRFTPVGVPGKKATQIRYGLGAVKGSGKGAIDAVIEARKERPFTDLFDFAKRVDKRQINRRTIDSLIRAGAFDCFNVDRAILLASVAFAMECAEQAEAAANQVSLFGGDDSDLETPPEYVKVSPWSDKQRLTEEKGALGFYLSGHLFNAYAEEASRFARTKLSKIEPSREPRTIAGVISGLRTQMTQRGRITIVTLDDGSATVDVTVYNELYDANRHMFKEDEFLAVTGKVSEDRFSGGLRITAEKVMDIAGVRIQYANCIRLSLPATTDINVLKATLQPAARADGSPVVIQYQNPKGVSELCFSEQWRINPDDNIKQKLIDLYSDKNVQIAYD